MYQRDPSASEGRGTWRAFTRNASADAQQTGALRGSSTDSGIRVRMGRMPDDRTRSSPQLRVDQLKHGDRWKLERSSFLVKVLILVIGFFIVSSARSVSESWAIYRAPLNGGAWSSKAVPRREFPPGTLRVLMVGHELSQTGAPLCLIKLAQHLLSQGMDVRCIFIRDGTLGSALDGLDIPYTIGSETADPTSYDVLFLNTLDVSEFVASFWLRYQVEKYGIEVLDNVVWWVHELPGLSPFPDIMTLQYVEKARHVAYATRFASYVMDRVLDAPREDIEVFLNGSVDRDSLHISNDWYEITDQYVEYLKSPKAVDDAHSTKKSVIPPVGAVEIPAHSDVPCMHPRDDKLREDERQRTRRLLGIPQDGVVLSYVGSVKRRNKGFFDAFVGSVLAVSRLDEDLRKTISCVFILSDYDEVDVDELTAQADEKDVQALFVEPMESLAPLYAASDVLLMTSSADIFPLIGLEGMASSVATVLARSTGLIDMCPNDQACRYYTPEDHEDLANVIRDLVVSKSYITMGQNGCKWAREEKATNRSLDNWSTLIRKVGQDTVKKREAGTGSLTSLAHLESSVQLDEWQEEELSWGCLYNVPFYSVIDNSMVRYYARTNKLCRSHERMVQLSLAETFPKGFVQARASAPIAVCDHTMTVSFADGLSCSLGGLDRLGKPCSKVLCLVLKEPYNWVTLPDMPVPVYGGSAVYDGKAIHVLGGSNETHNVTTNHWRMEMSPNDVLTNPEKLFWETDTKLPVPLAFQSTIVSSDGSTLYSIGGEKKDGLSVWYGRVKDIVQGIPEAWKLSDGKWTSMKWDAGNAHLGISRVHPSCVVKISNTDWLLIGGQHRPDWLSTFALHFDAKTNHIKAAGPVTPTLGAICARVNETIWVIGGARGMHEFRREIYLSPRSSRHIRRVPVPKLPRP